MDYTGKRLREDGAGGDGEFDSVTTKKLCLGEGDQICFPEAYPPTNEGHYELRSIDGPVVEWAPVSSTNATTVTYKYEGSAITVDPSTTPLASGFVRFNNASPQNASVMWVNHTDLYGVLRQGWLDTRDPTGNIEIYKHEEGGNKSVVYGYSHTSVTPDVSWTEFGLAFRHFTPSLNQGDVIGIHIEGSGAGTEIPVLTTPATFGEYKTNEAAALPFSKILTNENLGDGSFQGFLASTPELVSDETSNIDYGDDGTYQQIVIKTSGTYKIGFNVGYTLVSSSADVVWKFFVNGASAPVSPGIIEKLTNNVDTRITTWSGLTTLAAGDRIDVRVAQLGGSGANIEISAVNFHLHLLQVPGTGGGGGGTVNLSTFFFPPTTGNVFNWNDANEFFFCIATNHQEIKVSTLTMWLSQSTAAVSFDYSFYIRDLNNAGTTGGNSYVNAVGGTIFSSTTPIGTGPHTTTFAEQTLPALTNRNAYYLGIKFKNVGAATIQSYSRLVDGTQSTIPAAGLVNPVAPGDPLRDNPGAPTGAVQSLPFFQLY